MVKMYVNRDIAQKAPMYACRYMGAFCVKEQIYQIPGYQSDIFITH